MVLNGVIMFFVGDMFELFVDVDDIVEIVVVVFIEDCYVGEIYEVIGFCLMSFVDIVLDLLDVMGCEIVYIDIFYVDFVDEIFKFGVLKDVVWMLDYFFVIVFDGCNVYLIDGV